MKIALIGCTKSKKNQPCPAKELYTPSPLFSYAYNYAKENADKVYILSALHGLTPEDKILAPYNETLNGKSPKEKLKWAKQVYSEMEETFDLDNDEFVFLAGENYRHYLVEMIKKNHSAKIEIPLKGLGLGRQLQFLKEYKHNTEQPKEQELGL